jgi:DNA polymerase-3 subunit gamma/tau
MVFYRKYRPQKINDLGNEQVRKNLYSIFSKSSYPHAFLFTGPKGLGKTSAARIVAKVVNCEKHKGFKGQKTEKEIEPDNKCLQCTSISNGNNLDVLEIDGASNRGIDEIRDLKEKINLAPFKAEKKVYIIDEVHMLTTEAFNALLKTLEEPPEHALFILCTTEVQKVPATILSRTTHITFTRATEDELVRSFQRIVKEEGLKIDKEALFEIAKISDGSFRDGAKILEEVAVFAGRKNITKDLVNEKYNTLGVSQSVLEMLDSLISKDTKKSIKLVRDLSAKGVDFKLFIEQLTDLLHKKLLQKVGVEKGDGLNITLSDIGALFKLLTEAYQDTKYSVLPQIPLELAILEWGIEKEVTKQEETFKKEKVEPTPSKSSFTNPANGNFLNKLIDEVKTNNHLIAGVLRSCSAEEVKNGILNIVAKSKFHKEKLEETETIKLIEQIAGSISGKKVKVQILLKEVN